MELSFEYYDFLESISESPEIMVFAAAFGTPLFMLLLTPFARLYRSSSINKILNIIIFGSLAAAWIGGFVLMIVLMFAGVSGMKLFLIWLIFTVATFIFMIINHKEVLKLYTTEIEKRIEKSDK